MKRMFWYMAVIGITLAVSACKNKKGNSIITPVSSGSPYEVLVVADRAFWIPADSALYRVLDSDVPALPQPERSFRISYVTPQMYDRSMSIFRNIIMVDCKDIYTQTKFKFMRNVHAAPQIIMTIQTPSKAEFDAYLEKNGQEIVDFFTRVELNRRITYLKDHHNKLLLDKVQKQFGYTIWASDDLKSFKTGQNFFWASSELNDLNLVIYTYLFRSNATFTKSYFIAKRDSVMKANIPGSREGMYMQTSDSVFTEIRSLNVNGEYVFEARGLWDMKHDAMGGPYVAHVKVDKQKALVVVAEGFVYNPGKLKRDKIRELNAALYTLQLPGEQEMHEITPSPAIDEVAAKTEKTQEKQ